MVFVDAVVVRPLRRRVAVAVPAVTRLKMPDAYGSLLGVATRLDIDAARTCVICPFELSLRAAPRDGGKLHVDAVSLVADSRASLIWKYP